MQAQDAATAYFFKAWEWVEANTKTVVIGAIIIIAAAIVLSYYFWQQNQSEVNASEALTELLISTPPNSTSSQVANGYLKIATEYPGTQAAGRALVLGAGTQFASGNYAEAQATFQKYLNTEPNGPFAASAALGVAASLDAQGKTDLAAKAYQRVINGFTDANAVDSAKFGLARIDEEQGKFNEAQQYYQEVVRANPNSPLGAEAAIRARQLMSKTPATQSTNSPTGAFHLSTHP